MRPRSARRLVVSVLLTWALTGFMSGLEAGSIFMKNGYIIQGPVVEHTDEGVVLGWENGKMTIARRFVENVVYDPGEEARIKQLRSQRIAEKEEAEQAAMAASVTREIEDLPPDLSVFLDELDEYAKGKTAPDSEEPGTGDVVVIHDVPDATVPEGDPPNEGAVDGVATGGDPDEGPTEPEDKTLQATSELVDSPANQLGDRVFATDQEFSLKLPAGWTTNVAQDAWIAQGTASEAGVIPSINVISLPPGELSLAECVQLAKDEHEVVLEDYQILSEQERTLAEDQQGYEIVARGEFESKSMVMRQFFVPHKDRICLFSAFTEGGAEDASFVLVDEAFKTIEFAAE